MKNINIVRVISFVLMLLMVSSVVACATPGDSVDTTTAAPTGSDTTTAPSGGDATDPAGTTEPAETELTPDLPDVSYNDKTIKFLEREIEMGNNIDVYFNEFYADLSLAEPVSNAVYDRNMAIEDKYGIKIESIRVKNSELKNTFTNQADAGGVYNGQWIMATTRWVTKVYKPAAPLPRTGY